MIMSEVVPMRIALVDDHRILLDGIESLLSGSEEYEVVVKESNSADLLGSPHLGMLDLLIMDINMPELDGIEVLKQLQERGFAGKCIILSSYDDLYLVNEAIQAGARGYITKSSATEYLEEALQIVQDGQLYYSPDIKERILQSFATPMRTTPELNNEETLLRQLTDREREILQLIAQQYTSEEIGLKLFIAKSTVDTHRKNLINKLKVKNAVGLGLFAKRNGLI
ncbi:MAG: response regulator transcription factor [Saprospiraceae bacterium]|nr:response regulator transcription factor [Saprospiraceae bacterium]